MLLASGAMVVAAVMEETVDLPVIVREPSPVAKMMKSPVLQVLKDTQETRDFYSVARVPHADRDGLKIVAYA